MTFLNAQETNLNLATKATIFLAGSIAQEGAPNWRHRVTELLQENYTLIDPTDGLYHKLDTTQLAQHIAWELDALKQSELILLNFLPTASSPISLVELGLYMNSTKLIVVCPTDYFQHAYIKVLCEKYNTPMHAEIDSALATLLKEK